MCPETMAAEVIEYAGDDRAFLVFSALILAYGCTAIAEISTFKSRGKRATSTCRSYRRRVLEVSSVDFVHLSELINGL